MDSAVSDTLYALGMKRTNSWKLNMLKNEAVTFRLELYFEWDHEVELYALEIHYNYTHEKETYYFKERHEVDEFINNWISENCYVSFDYTLRSDEEE